MHAGARTLQFVWGIGIDEVHNRVIVMIILFMPSSRRAIAVQVHTVHKVVLPLCHCIRLFLILLHMPCGIVITMKWPGNIAFMLVHMRVSLCI